MNLRHAAALALLGWYLMIPPVVSDGHGGYIALIDSPLSKWAANRSFDHADECDSFQLKLVIAGGKGIKRLRHHTLDWALADSYTQAQCIFH